MNPLSLILSIPGVLGGSSPFPKRDPGMSIDSPLNTTSDSGDTQGTSTVMKSGTGTGAKGKGGINYGTGLYDPEQSARILENMQAFKNQREGSSGNMMSPLDQHLQSAIAYGTGNPEDILNIQKQSQDNAKSAFDMQMQIEQFKAGQAQQAAFNKMKDKFLTGANAPSGAEGSANLGGISNIYTLPTEIQNALAGAQTKAEWDKIYNEYAKDVNVERAKNFYNIDWNKPILLGFGKGVNSTTKQMSLRDAQKYLHQPDVTIMDPSTGQQLDATGKPAVSSNTSIRNKPAAPKFTPDPSLVPKARTEYKEGGRVQHYADGNSVFADVPPTLVADASNIVRIPAAPVVNVSPNPSKVVTRPAPIESYPTAPEEIAKNRDIRNTIETTGGNEREKEDMLDIKDLQSRAAQAKNALDDVQRYEQYLDKHPNIFAPITSHPILKDVVPFLEALPGIKKPGSEAGHGWDLRNAITNTELDEKELGYRNNADALATQLGIAYAKLNFPGRMTNMELGQQQKAKGLSVDDPTTSNQLAINLIKHEAAKNLGLANAWQKFYEQEAKMGIRPTWTNFKSTDAYSHWKSLSPGKESLGDNPQNTIKTNAGHTVQKVGD